MKPQEQLKSTNLTEEVRHVKLNKQKHVGTIVPHEGHSVFEFNKVNFQLKKADFENTSAYQLTKGAKAQQMRKSVKVNDNCFYISCLNIKNAMKQINKRFNPEFILVLTD